MICLQDDESQFEWSDTCCILLGSRFISIGDKSVDLREFDKVFGPILEDGQIFFKMRVGIKPGTSWCKILDWEIEDYESVLNNDPVMYKLQYLITPDPTYIQEMKSNLRELKINELMNDTNN